MRRWVLFFVGLFALLMSAGWLSTRSSFFTVSNFDVRTDREELARHLRLQLMPYLGKSLFKLSLENLERELKELPDVLEVAVRKRWPHTLRVDAQWRVPVLSWQGDKPGVFRDCHGKAFVPSAVPEIVPILKGKVGDSVLETIAKFLGGRGVAAFPARTEFFWNAQSGLELRRDGLPLVFLGFDQFDQAFANAEYFLQGSQGALELGVVQSIDAAYKQRVIVSFQSPLKISENSLNLKEIVQRKAKN